MIFQGILLFVIATILISGIAKARKRDMSVVMQWCWTLLWGIAALLVWKPEITSWIATAVGIGRGADLILYIAIITLTVVVFSLLLWVDSLDERITRLVQHIALDEYDRKAPPKSGDSDPHV